MIEPKLLIKLSYIIGLKEVVIDELNSHPNLTPVGEGVDSIYLEFVLSQLEEIKQLRSVARAYIVIHDERYHPAFLFNHKSIMGDLLGIVLVNSSDRFKSYKLSCAGVDSMEVRSIAKYVKETYGLIEQEEADAKIHIIKLDDVWEVGIQLTPRPLSVRNYRVKNMSGAMDPTIAYAVNSFCKLDESKTYLNPFSGSATLLIEAGECYPYLEQLVGFDNDKKHLSLSVQNIKKAGLIERVRVREANIFDRPDLGTFDVIASDLPFGMAVSKGEDLDYMYKTFVEYCEATLNKHGRLVVYTSEHEILEKYLLRFGFKVVKTLQLKFITSVDAYLYPKIFVCEFE